MLKFVNDTISSTSIILYITWYMNSKLETEPCGLKVSTWEHLLLNKLTNRLLYKTDKQLVAEIIYFMSNFLFTRYFVQQFLLCLVFWR